MRCWLSRLAGPEDGDSHQEWRIGQKFTQKEGTLKMFRRSKVAGFLPSCSMRCLLFARGSLLASRRDRWAYVPTVAGI